MARARLHARSIVEPAERAVCVPVRPGIVGAAGEGRRGGREGGVGYVPVIVLRVDLPLLGELLLDRGEVVGVICGGEVGAVGVVAGKWLAPADMREGVRIGRANGGHWAERGK